jgi:hypothetical protein
MNMKHKIAYLNLALLLVATPAVQAFSLPEWPAMKAYVQNVAQSVVDTVKAHPYIAGSALTTATGVGAATVAYKKNDRFHKYVNSKVDTLNAKFTDLKQKKVTRADALKGLAAISGTAGAFYGLKKANAKYNLTEKAENAAKFCIGLGWLSAFKMQDAYNESIDTLKGSKRAQAVTAAAALGTIGAAGYFGYKAYKARLAEKHHDETEDVVVSNN